MTNFAVEICKPIVPGSPSSTFPGVFGILGSDFIGLCMLSLMVSLLMMALVHIFANFLRNQPLIAWTKFELFQVLATAGLFAFTAGIVIGMCTFDMGFLDGDYHGKNMYKIVSDYFDNLKVLSGLLFSYLMYVAKMVNFFAKITWLSNPLGAGMNDSPMEAMGQINSVLFLVIGGFFTSVLMLWVQMRIMDYMAIASIFYLFPFGIFFRAFEPTRKFGGTLMGIAMTFFLFYPIVIIFNEYVMTDQIESVTAETATALQNAEGNSAAGAGGPQAAKEAKDKHDEFKGGGVPNAADLSLSVSNGAIFVLKPVMLYVIAAVVLPVINFIILVEVARALTAQLGEEVDVSNLTRMI